jgi:hypothetical protein
MERVYIESSEKIEKALLGNYQRKIMAGQSVRKAAQFNVKNNT